MIAAIYCRKSTEQHVADEQKSVTRQTENARTFAAAHGWSVDPQFVCADDGISGAETSRLRERQRMIDLITSGHCPFGVLIMQAPDRFSRRDGDEAFGELKRLARHVEIWFYADARRFAYGTFESNVNGMLQSEFAAEFRRTIAAKTHEAHRRLAARGSVTGGRVFGYDLVDVMPDGRRITRPPDRRHRDPEASHVELAINDAQAAVVLRIFTLAADGVGQKQIALRLNAAGAPAPRPQQGRPSGWVQSSVHGVLYNELYRGVQVWNKTKKRNASGAKEPHARPEDEWQRTPVPDLRIVPEAVWLAAHAGLAERRALYQDDTKGLRGGRPRVESKTCRRDWRGAPSAVAG